MVQARDHLLQMSLSDDPFLQSSLYATSPQGCPHGADDYLNAVVEFTWPGTVEELLVHCQGIERALGRIRSGIRCEPRTADVDIIYVGDMVVNDPPRLILPHPDSDIKRPGLTPGKLLGDFLLTFVTFFKKKNLGLMFFFLLTYRLGESQLAKIASPFLLDTTDKGGLGLSTATVGMIYGTIGVIALLLGGIISGFLVSRDGFKKWILPMALAINIPDLLYVWMAAATPDNPIFIAICVAIEQLGYGFGFTAYMLYLIYIAEGEHKTAHYAIGTGFMALGMMLPGMPAGWIQEHLGYTNFFIWVCICTLPGIVASFMIRNRLEDSFGKKQ